MRSVGPYSALVAVVVVGRTGAGMAFVVEWAETPIVAVLADRIGWAGIVLPLG